MLEYDVYVNEKEFEEVVESLELLFDSSNAPTENNHIKVK